MRAENPLTPLFDRLSSPLVLLDETGHVLLANPAGAQRYKSFFVMCSPISNDQLATPIIQRLGYLTCPALLLCEDGLVSLSPLDNGQLLLEWLAETGNEKLLILQEVGQAVNSSLIMEDIFEALGDVLGRYIPYEEAVIVILDDSQNGIKILVRMTREGDLEITGENNAFAGYDPVIDRILREPTSHLYAKGELPDSVVFSRKAGAALVVPLINKGIVIGLVAMSTHQEGGFYYYQEELLNQVSVQLAVAVENAKFYWQTQAQASREFLINQLTMAIRQSLDIDMILSTAVMELGKVMGVSRCYIRYLRDDNHAELQQDLDSTGHFFGYCMPGVAQVDALNEVDFERRVFQLRKDETFNPFILNDVRDCPPSLSGTFFEDHQIKSLAVIPILIGQSLVGTITLHQCDAFRVWVMEDIGLLKAMAEHLGVALHQAGLFWTLDNQRRQLEQTLAELQQAQVYLIQSEKMAVLGQFVAGIAHEVNTPLGTMVSNNDTLKTISERLKGDPSTSNLNTLLPMMSELLDLNKMASERIQEIVKSLRNFARLDESERKTVDIHEGIDSTLLVMKSSLDPRIDIIKAYDKSIPPVQCFPGLLNQVFMNLLVNATHALEDKLNANKLNAGQKPASVTISTAIVPKDNTVEITFTDTGKGIAPENLTKIFDPGFTTKGVGVGTGLGLALCYRIMEKHGGYIKVESTPGEGTTFIVVLPLV